MLNMLDSSATLLPTKPTIDSHPSIRLLTMNMCLQLPGARNRYNVALIKNTCIILLVASLPASHLVYLRTSLSPLYSLPLLFLLSIIVTQPLAMVVSGVIYMFLNEGFSEFKTERILEFSKHVEQYDIICCQEIYGSWWFGSRYYQTLMKREAKRRGLLYSSTSGRPALPAIMFDQGLTIYSRYPITRSRRKLYQSQSPWDRLFVNRAALYAEVQVPGSMLGSAPRSLHVFTTHTTPSLSDMSRRSGLAKLLADGPVPTVVKQCGELKTFIESMTAGSRRDDLLVVMGDFNVNAGSIEYQAFERDLGALGLKDVTPLPRGGATTTSEREEDTGTTTTATDTLKWEPTFACVCLKTGRPLETLLTCPDLQGRPQCLDFVFVGGGGNQAESKRQGVVPFTVVNKKFQQVSDHCGVAAVVTFGDRLPGAGTSRDRKNV